MDEIILADFLWVIFLSLFAGFYAIKIQIPALINIKKEYYFIDNLMFITLLRSD